MIDPVIFKKIRRIEIQSKRPVNQLLAGEYRSVFKGLGLEFHEVREYQPDDDIRAIDWNVTARLGHPYVKKYVEERQRTIILTVDVSASQDFGSLRKSKNEVAAELAAILAFAAIQNNDLAGLLMFSDRVEKFIPPKKGRRHVLRLVREILAFKREGSGTDIAGAVKYLARVQRKSAIVFLISDFLAGGYERELTLLARRHDLIPVWIRDRYERSLPPFPGLIVAEDPESGAITPVDLSDPAVGVQYRQAVDAVTAEQKKYFNRIRADLIEFSTDGDYLGPLNAFFRKREKRLKH
ncbi:MAG TPA: DUF58 domain-containing protein [Candidatus Sulfotelmatobacter sp.]|nr:DUF58 domain-containing protein [Candidatus Sulfotelmatobacter sp.]